MFTLPGPAIYFCSKMLFFFYDYSPFYPFFNPCTIALPMNERSFFSSLRNVLPQGKSQKYELVSLAMVSVTDSSWLVFWRWPSHQIDTLSGVANGKIRDWPRRRDPCLKIRDRDYKIFENPSPRPCAEKIRARDLIIVCYAHYNSHLVTRLVMD